MENDPVFKAKCVWICAFSAASSSADSHDGAPAARQARSGGTMPGSVSPKTDRRSGAVRQQISTAGSPISPDAQTPRFRRRSGLIRRRSPYRQWPLHSGLREQEEQRPPSSAYATPPFLRRVCSSHSNQKDTFISHRLSDRLTFSDLPHIIINNRI